MNSCFPFLTPDKPAPAGRDTFVANEPRFTIRAARVWDLSTLAEILTDSFHPRTGITRWAYPMLRLGIYEDLRNRLRSASPHYLCLVATVADAREQVAGNVELALRSPPSLQPRSLQYPYISNLAVTAEYRRQGVARQLLLACERTVREWGFSDAYLHVLENNHQARQLYLKSGYRLERVEPSCGAWLLGRPKRLLLHKSLKSTAVGQRLTSV